MEKKQVTGPVRQTASGDKEDRKAEEECWSEGGNGQERGT